MSQKSPARKPLPALRLFEGDDSEHTNVQERLGFSSEESTMITSLERLNDRDMTGVSERLLSDDELAIDSASDASTASSKRLGQGPQVEDTSKGPPPSPPALQAPPALQVPTAPQAPPAVAGQSSSPSFSEEESQVSLEPSALSEAPPSLEPLLEQHLPTDELPVEPPPLEPEPMRRPPPVIGGTQGLVISGFNARGGVGCTSVLLTLAGALQSRDFRVVVVDMDLQLATLSSSLEVKLERSLAELLMETQANDGPIRSAFDYHKSGVAVVAQEERISEISAVTPERLPRLFAALRQSFDVVLVDGLRNFSDIAVAVMDDSDMVLLPVTQDIPAVRSARKVLKLFNRLGYEGGKTRVVLNRFHKRSLVSEEVIEEHLRCVISERLPNDFRFVSQGLTEGELLHALDPKHPFCLAADRLAAQLMGFPAPTQQRGLLARLLGRGG